MIGRRALLGLVAGLPLIWRAGAVLALKPTKPTPAEMRAALDVAINRWLREHPDKQFVASIAGGFFILNPARENHWAVSTWLTPDSPDWPKWRHS